MKTISLYKYNGVEIHELPNGNFKFEACILQFETLELAQRGVIKYTDTDTLLDHLANATATQSCGGHWKGQMNEKRAKKYAEELTFRGVEIPTQSELFENGIFNGEGSQ